MERPSSLSTTAPPPATIPWPTSMPISSTPPTIDDLILDLEMTKFKRKYECWMAGGLLTVVFNMVFSLVVIFGGVAMKEDYDRIDQGRELLWRR